MSSLGILGCRSGRFNGEAMGRFEAWERPDWLLSLAASLFESTDEEPYASCTFCIFLMTGIFNSVESSNLG